MTVPTEISRISYDATIGTGPYPYTWKILESSELDVYDNDTLLIENTHYAVSGVGTDGGGNVTLTTTPTLTDTILIIDSPEYTQGTDYTANDTFPAGAHENALDKVTRLCLRLKEKMDRAITFAISSSTSGIIVPDPEAGKVIGWDSTGSTLQNMSMLDVSAITASAIGTSIVSSADATAVRSLLQITAADISPFMQTVLDDTTSAMARDTLTTGLARFSAYVTATELGIVKSVYTKIAFQGEKFDIGGCFDSSTNYRFTAPRTGYYQFNCGLNCKSAAGNIGLRITPYKNGSGITYMGFEKGTSAFGETSGHWSDIVYLTSGQYIEIYTLSDDSAASVLGNTAGQYSYFSGFEL